METLLICVVVAIAAIVIGAFIGLVIDFRRAVEQTRAIDYW
jgi:type III secretory pathway component EscS